MVGDARAATSFPWAGFWWVCVGAVRTKGTPIGPDAFPTVKAYVRVVLRRPAGALVGASGRADRLIVTKPDHGARVHHLGSTARALLRDAECPVEVVPPRQGPEDIAGFDLERGGELVP